MESLLRPAVDTGRTAQPTERIGFDATRTDDTAAPDPLEATQRAILHGRRHPETVTEANMCDWQLVPDTKYLPCLCRQLYAEPDAGKLLKESKRSKDSGEKSRRSRNG